MLTNDTSIEEIEIALMLEGLYRLYGCDFRGLSERLLLRKIKHYCKIKNLQSVSLLQERLFRSPKCLNEFSQFMSVSASSMFRDPEFYLAIRNLTQHLPELPLIHIWQMGCSTGQDAYSLAIVLAEEGLYERCRIYATDSNLLALKQARTGVLPLSAMRQYTENYIHSGGSQGFSSYYTANQDAAQIDHLIRKNITFGIDDLNIDRSNQFHMIVVRDVLVHLDDQQREHVLERAHESLLPQGILAMGRWDTLQNTSIETYYEELDSSYKLYKRYVRWAPIFGPIS